MDGLNELASLRRGAPVGPGRDIPSPKASLQRYVARAVEVPRGRDRRRCASGDGFPRRRVTAGPGGPRRRTGSATRYAPVTRATSWASWSRGGRDPRGAACERSQLLRAQGASRRRASTFERHRLRRSLVRPWAVVTAAPGRRVASRGAGERHYGVKTARKALI